MSIKTGPRHGTLQFWPRKRSDRDILRVNWSPLTEKTRSEKSNLLGFICYKAGMKSAYVKDNTPNSLTKNKRIIFPVTLLECPTIKIFSIRFYKNGKVLSEVINDNVDKEMQKKVKLPKIPAGKTGLEKAEKSLEFDDIKVLIYSQVKKTGIKKTPDIAEIGLSGDKDAKLKFIKENLHKEISISEVFAKGLVDVRGVTKGKGFQGSVKRFGVKLRFHKSEKGQRRIGSVGSWHPARSCFQVPFPGQMGLFSRVIYNNMIIAVKKSTDKDIASESGLKNYGKIKNDCLVIRGSLQGANKKQLLITKTLRPTKRQLRHQFDLIELR